MNDFNVMVALLGALILLLALASAWLAKSPLPPTLICMESSRYGQRWGITSCLCIGMESIQQLAIMH